MPAPRRRFRDVLQNAAIRGILAALLLVPYRVRIPLMGWLTSRIVAPLAGWDRRVRDNLSHVMPDMPSSEVRRLMRAVPDNAGRAMIELYSGATFQERVRDTVPTGPGLAAFAAARAQNRPTILVTGHFGNYEVARAALIARGFSLAGLYREMKNPAFNAHYVRALSALGTPVFPTTRKGISRFIAHLKAGGAVGVLIDIYAGEGARVDFFGKTAPTATSAMEWAVKYQAVVIPIYGRRRADGLSFDVVLDAALPLSDPVTMTQGANDSLERMVRADMDQWFWIHRRWKPEDQRRRAAATTGP